MGIFRHNEIDLSDEGLFPTAAESNEMSKEAAADREQPAAETEKDAAPLTPERTAEGEPGEAAEELLSGDELAERDAAWQTAAAEVVALWPQAKGAGRELIARMNEIGARYGDPLLWQKAPAGIMREAAIELYGLPRTRDNDYAKAAARAAREAALSEQERRSQAKAGLARGKKARRPAAPPSEEERIIAEIAEARRHSIF